MNQVKKLLIGDQIDFAPPRNRLGMNLFLTGRFLLGGFLIFNGFNHFLSLSTMVDYAAANGVIMPELAVQISGLLLLFSGFSLLSGYRPIFGVAAASLFFIPVTLTMHPFWRETGAAYQNDFVHFMKNMAILGSIWMHVAIPRPWPVSIDQTERAELRITKSTPENKKEKRQKRAG